jgi:DNA topoisomerase VI subunit B
LYKVVKEINWRNYKLSQDEGNLPYAPIVIVVSLISTKVPYIVPGKFAVAYHEEIREQLKLALQTLGRMIYGFISHRQRQEHEKHRQSIFQIYAKEVAKDLSILAGRDEQILMERLLESVKHKKPKKAMKPAPTLHTLPPVPVAPSLVAPIIPEPPEMREAPTIQIKAEAVPQKKAEKKPQYTLDSYFGR